MIGLRYALVIAAGLGVALLIGAAQAQENYDAGKTGAQLFASDCEMCHKRPEGLAKAGGILGLKHFLSLHYTSSEQSAAVLADYLKSVDRNANAAPPSASKPRRTRRAPKPEDRAGTKTPARGSDAKPHAKHKAGHKTA